MNNNYGHAIPELPENILPKYIGRDGHAEPSVKDARVIDAIEKYYEALAAEDYALATKREYDLWGLVLLYAAMGHIETKDMAALALQTNTSRFPRTWEDYR